MRMRAYILSIQTVLFFSPALSVGNLALSFISYYLLYVLQGLVYNLQYITQIYFVESPK